ncbi:FkbM family methyltransferase [Halorubrum sp. CBA1125]|uniref:FkbM family methyltransferase n=1 Tax=Halorubrum sp. CBA1125 TaxID=2668072 RepID=UPI002AA2A767|nr:FkbM family methyltransferase [Halorubrum sp. CBA1125]
MTYAVGIATPKRTVAGTYWSYEPTNPHGDDPGLAALDGVATDAVVVDVGAHVGEYAIPLARDTDREVIAFEPNPVSADRLARNARRNDVSGTEGDGNGIDIRRAGVGEAPATLPFYRSTFSKCSAFDRDRATRWSAVVAGVEQVPIRRLDDLVEGVAEASGADESSGAADAVTDGDPSPIPAPDAIKVDVEGRELAVLRGACQTIETYRPLLVVEVHGAADDGDGSEGGGDELGAAGETGEHVRAVREWLAERRYAVEPAGDVWICRPRS